MFRSGLIAVVLALSAGAASCADPVEGKFGAELYGVACAHCHGTDLEGGIGTPLGVGSLSFDLRDSQVGGAIAVGPGSMPSYGRRLTPEQIDSLVAYIRLVQGRG